MVNGLIGVRYGFGDMIFRTQRNLPPNMVMMNLQDMSESPGLLLREPFSTVRLTVVNHSRRQELHWNLENVGIEKASKFFESNQN
jgi:hypothetical protein